MDDRHSDSPRPDRGRPDSDRGGARRGDRSDAPRRHRDNSSFGERRGRRYDTSSGDADQQRGGGPRRGDRDQTGGHGRPSRNPGDERGRRDDRGDRRGAGSAGRGDGGADRRQSGPGGRSAGPRRAHGDNGLRPRTGGRPSDNDRRPARDEPSIPEDITADELDPELRRDLRGLDKANAEAVARHLVAAMYLIDDDAEKALAHGRAAKSRAGRIGVVRETVGVLAYRAGEWSEALGELRAARRISGGPGLLALMADCERGMGRPERAIEVSRGEESRGLDGADLHELRIVEAGARMDLGQVDAALVTLRDAGVDADATGEDAARLDYAYAEILLVAERRAEAEEWFGHAVAADPLATDADVRLAELEG